MPTLPVPDRCIWCLQQPPDVPFEEAPILPASVGASRQRILPPGVVCRRCAGYFTGKVEPALLADPLFHATAAFLGLADRDDMNEFRDRLFDEAHRPVDRPERKLDLGAAIREEEGELTVYVAYTIQGRLSRAYTRGELALLSRAIHRIAFESLAWHLYVAGEGLEEPLDPFASVFEPVRAWARQGKPRSAVRPVLRCPGRSTAAQFETKPWRLGRAVGIEIDLFGDWYGVALTSKPSDALKDLRAWAGEGAEELWCLAETIRSLRGS